ncbi:hypothetical protein [Pseudomonas coleopterorum]|uniref:hypothetical protein n=1 Tax=Pseudomonas coleopterorum TaxID=1605838 RepID=UPI0017844212|nr:hypothetical protein [Pseudomonas coleopterorum]MBD8480787.1 hypothetical protein [Pseudomonas coleopterorum]
MANNNGIEIVRLLHDAIEAQLHFLNEPFVDAAGTGIDRRRRFSLSTPSMGRYSAEDSPPPMAKKRAQTKTPLIAERRFH